MSTSSITSLRFSTLSHDTGSPASVSSVSCAYNTIHITLSHVSCVLIMVGTYSRWLGCTYPDEGLHHWVAPTLMRDCITGWYLLWWETVLLRCAYPDERLYHGFVPTLMRDCTTGLYLPWWGTVPLCCTYPLGWLYHCVVPTLMRDCTTGLHLISWGTVPLGYTYPDEGLYHWVVPTL